MPKASGSASASAAAAVSITALEKAKFVSDGVQLFKNVRTARTIFYSRTRVTADATRSRDKAEGMYNKALLAKRIFAEYAKYTPSASSFSVRTDCTSITDIYAVVESMPIDTSDWDIAARHGSVVITVQTCPE